MGKSHDPHGNSPRVPMGYSHGSVLEKNGCKNDKNRARRERAAGKPRTPPSGPAPIPASLGSEGFVEAWHDWLTVRRENRHPMTPRQQALVLARLDRVAQHPKGGVGMATALVRRSAEAGWRGIFPLEAQKPVWEATEATRWAADEEKRFATPAPSDLENLPDLPPTVPAP